MMNQVERLQPRHAAAYRALMLEAYERHPEAFTSSAEERAALPLSWWEQRLDASDQALEVVFAVTRDASLCGVVGLGFNVREKARHKVALFGMYVDPTWQKQGVGQALIRAALEHARTRPDALLVQLTVSENNLTARGLYERNGFVAFGVEPCAVAINGGFVSKVHMWRQLWV
jgi:ribosomal protein S18 acetylase RimI-like enzyme